MTATAGRAAPIARGITTTRTGHLHSRRRRERASRIARFIAALIICLVMIFPFYWMVVVSLSPKAELFSTVFRLWPSSLTLDNFTGVFDQLGLRHTNSTAIDVAALRARISSADSEQVISVLATAVCGVITAAIGLADPQLVVIGGEWGTDPAIYAALQTRVRLVPRPVPLELTRTGGNSALAGARSAALHALRADVITRSQHEH